MNQNLQQLIELLRERVPGLQAVYHYGSSARGQANAESDIDLAFLSGQLLPETALFEVRGECRRIAGADVDLVELRKADPVLAAEVIDGGKTVYIGDPNATAEFETAAISMYCAFNEEMRELIAAIEKRGSVYAR